VGLVESEAEPQPHGEAISCSIWATYAGEDREPGAEMGQNHGGDGYQFGMPVVVLCYQEDCDGR